MTLLRFPYVLLLTFGIGAGSVPAVAQQPKPGPMPTKAHVQDQLPDSLVFHARDAILRGLAYFSTPELPLDPDAVLLHAYLKDRFGIPQLYSARRVLADIRKDPEGTLYPFLCVAEAVPFRPEFLVLKGRSFDNITLAGLWYDKLQSPSVLTDRINASPIDDPYVATHALWAVAMARQCFHAQVDTLVELRLAIKVKGVIEHADPRWDDQAIEALAMLQYQDSTYVPPYGYIQEIVDRQNPDGSWSLTPGQEVHGSQHTTVLALWALLQYKPLAWPVQPRPMVMR